MSAPLFALQFGDKTILIKLFLKTCIPQPSKRHVLLSSLFEAVSRLKHGYMAYTPPSLSLTLDLTLHVVCHSLSVSQSFFTCHYTFQRMFTQTHLFCAFTDRERERERKREREREREKERASESERAGGREGGLVLSLPPHGGCLVTSI